MGSDQQAWCSRVVQQAMTARDVESALLARCTAVARGAPTAAQDGREAHVFALAAGLVRPQFPHASACLMQASERYFSTHPGERLAAAEVVRNGWVPGLPRLRDMLGRRLAAHGV